MFQSNYPSQVQERGTIEGYSYRIVYNFEFGYFVLGTGKSKDIYGASCFNDHDEAKEHAELSISGYTGELEEAA